MRADNAANKWGRRALGLLASVCALVAAAPARACDKDTDCKGTRVCVAKACVLAPVAPPPCRKDTECSGDAVCEVGRCVPPPAVQPPVVQPPVVQPTVVGPTLQAPPAVDPGALLEQPPVAAPVPQAPAPAAALRPARQQRTSLALVLPVRTSFVGVEGTYESVLTAISTDSVAMTLGMPGGLLAYAGSANVTVIQGYVGLTLGAQSAHDNLLEWAVRAGPLLRATNTTFGSDTESELSFAGMLQADLMLGFLLVGIEERLSHAPIGVPSMSTC